MAQAVPVKPGFHRQTVPLVAPFAGGGADGVGGLDDVQRFVAMDEVDRLELALEVGGQLLALQLHYCASSGFSGLIVDRRRSTCCTRSLSMSRQSSCSS